MKGKMPVLVVASHPDDEALGCGGTIAAYVKQGHPVHVAFMTDGIGARGGKGQSAAARKRKAAADKACRILGVTSAYFGRFPDNRMDSVDLLDVVKSIETLIAKLEPGTLLTHHAGDLNVDHRVVHDAVMTACRPQKGHPVRTVLFFEVPSSTEWQAAGTSVPFEPNWFIDISATLPLKMAALEAYGGEMRAPPHSRSLVAVEHLARWRGATIGVAAAEAFMLGRHLP